MWDMDLRRVNTVGKEDELKRAYALSFLSSLWLATGMEDNGGGNSNLFYMQNVGSVWSQQAENNFFDGRLHGAVVFLNRICVFLGDGIGTSSR